MEIQEYDRLSAVPPALDAAFEAAEAQSMFLGRPWLELFERTVASGAGRVRLLVHEPGADDALPPALLPCWSPGPSSRAQALANYYASLSGAVIDMDHSSAAECVHHLAAEAGQAGLSTIDLSPLSRDGTQFEALRQGLHDAGWWTQPYLCFGNWYLDCTAMRYEDYFASLASRVRNTVKRRGKQFAKLPGASLELITGGERLEAGISAYQAVYAQSWKQPEPYPQFVPDLIRLGAEQGWLRLGVAWLGELPVAAQIWLVVRGRCNIYKLAYDEAHKKLSAGSLLTDLLMRHVMDEDQVFEVDYLTGDDAYKQDWMTTRRERWGIAGFNPRTAAGLAAGIRHLGGARVKRFVSRFRRSPATEESA